jgi:hypothetical protein
VGSNPTSGTINKANMDLQNIFEISFILLMMGCAGKNYWEDLPGFILMVIGGCGMALSGGIITLRVAGLM